MTNNIDKNNLEKYDRQIRLFGREVQLKLNNLSVSIISSVDSFVSGEILKNVVLLGVNKIYADERTLKSFKKLVPNEIKDINPRVNMLKAPEGFYFLVGETEIESEEAFYISQDGSSYESKDGSNASKDGSNASKDGLNESKDGYSESKNNEGEDSLIKECLLGGIIVQEFIKKLQCQIYQKSFSLKNLI